MQQRCLTLVDEADLKGRISEAAERFRRDDCPRMSEGAATVRPYLDQMYKKAISRNDIDLADRVRRYPPLAS